MILVNTGKELVKHSKSISILTYTKAILLKISGVSYEIKKTMADNKQFVYTSGDFVYNVPSIKSSSTVTLSKFDKTLRSLWDKAMEGGSFKYTLDHVETKVLPGDKAYVVQRNVLRGILRRKPQQITSVNQPFNPDDFNFNQIKEEEILMVLRNDEEKLENTSVPNGITTSQVQPRNLMIINVSPLEYGHVLLVPSVDKCTPQRMDVNSIRQAMEMMLLSSHPGFRLGFNSLCALASVNHQHVHAFYTEFEVCTEYVGGKRLCNHLYELEGTSCRGFGFQLCDSNVSTLCSMVAKCIEYFQKKEIAHNLFFTRGVKFGDDRTNPERTVRLLLYPRKHFIGTKEFDLMFNTAVIELNGHIVIIDSDQYDTATEQEINEQIASASLEEEDFKHIKTELVNLLSNS